MCHWQYAVLVSTCDTFVESKVPPLLNKALLWVWLDSLSSITNVTIYNRQAQTPNLTRTFNSAAGDHADSHPVSSLLFMALISIMTNTT